MVIDVCYFTIMDMVSTNQQIMVNYGVNSNYTKYLPVSMWDIAQWFGTPSVIVIDCSGAGEIHNNFRERKTDIQKE